MVLSVICFTVTSIPFSWKILFILSKDFIYSSRRWYFGSLQLKYCSIPDHASVKAKISSSSYSLLPLSHFCTGRPLFFLISTSLSVVSVVSSTRSLQLSSFEFLYKVKFDTKSNNNITFGNSNFKLYVIIMLRTSFRVNPQSIVCLNAKELLARSRRHIWSLSDSNLIQSHSHLVGKRTLNHLAKLAKIFLILNDWAVLWVLICTVHLTACHYHVTHESQSESTLYSLPECQGTPCSKQVPYLKVKWQQSGQFG